MSSLLTKRKMFVIATSIFMVTMSTVLFLVGEDKIAVESEDLQAFVLTDNQIENKLDEAEYRELLEIKNDEFAIVNSERYFEFFTKNLEEIHGYKLDENLDMNALSLVHPKDLTEFANTLMEYNKDPKIRSGIGPIRIKTISGEYIPYLIELKPIVDEKGHKIGSAVILKDISTPLGEINKLVEDTNSLINPET